MGGEIGNFARPISYSPGVKRPGPKKVCPRCGGTLVYDGVGYSCISCRYKIRRSRPRKRKTRK